MAFWSADVKRLDQVECVRCVQGIRRTLDWHQVPLTRVFCREPSGRVDAEQLVEKHQHAEVLSLKKTNFKLFSNGSNLCR